MVCNTYSKYAIPVEVTIPAYIKRKLMAAYKIKPFDNGFHLIEDEKTKEWLGKNLEICSEWNVWNLNDTFLIRYDWAVGWEVA